MQLKYIWVKKFNSIENLGVNLSHTGKHRFKYEKGSLKITTNQKPVLEFGESISSITAIAGKNGSGKSSLCEIILHAMATLTEGSMGYNRPFDGIVCFDVFIFHHDSILIRNKIDLEKNGYTLVAFKETPLESFLNELGHDLQHLGFMYYSNVIDWRSGLSENNLSNISTQSQIHSDLYYGPHYPYHPQDDREQHQNTYYGKVKMDLMDGYQYEEAFRQTNFYLNFSQFIPFNHPSHLRIFLNYSGNNKWLSLDDFPYEVSSKVQEYERTIFDNLTPSYHVDVIADNKDIKIDAALVKKAASWLYKYNLLVSYSKEKNTLPTSQHTADFVFNGDYPAEIFDEHKDLVSELVQLMDSIIESSEVYETYNPVYLSSRLQGDWRIALVESLTVPNTAKIRELLKKIIDAENLLLNYEYRSIKRLNNYFMIPKPSAGEFSFLSLFSRIYQAIKWNELGHYDRKYFVLFIDEGEINFHPAWKKRFIKWLVEYLNTGIHKYKFQVIITTHSPYLLSDLSSDSVILLDIIDGKTNVLESGSYKTFGANIHELLADSFFLKDGFIGDYAQEIIESLVSYLTNQKDGGDWSKDRAQRLIELIADDLIRQRLVDLYALKFDEPNSLRDEIAILEQRVKLLKSRLK